MNKSGKTLIIFAILMIVILVASTSIGFFLYHQEKTLRKSVENDLEVSHESEAKAQAEVKELKKQQLLLQDKNKEADEKINNLLDEMELNEGLRKELKKENDQLKGQIDSFNKSKDKSKAEADQYQKRVEELQGLLDAQKERASSLAGQLESLQKIKQETVLPQAPIVNDQKVELDKIVVNPNDSGVKGRVLSVDKDSEFIICNLGLKQGVKSGDFLAVYRGEEYLGDIKATRVQDQMSAADIVPPFSSRKVRKNDSVIIKPQ